MSKCSWCLAVSLMAVLALLVCTASGIALPQLMPQAAAAELGAVVDENITLSLLTEQTCLAHDMIGVSVSAPGASFVRVYWGSDDWCEDVWPNEDGYQYVEIGFREFGTGTHAIYARACYDELPEEFNTNELNYGNPSAPVYVECTADREAVAPILQLGKETVQQGEMLPVTIIPQDDTWIYDLRLYNVVGSGDEIDYQEVYGDRYEHGGYEPFTVYLPAGRLEAGACAVNVIACAEGLDWGFTALEDYSFTVTANDMPLFSVSAEEVPTLEPVTLMIYAPGADGSRFIWENVDEHWSMEMYPDWRDGYWSYEQTMDFGATYHVTAQYLTGDFESGMWHDIATKDVRFLSNGDLAEPYIQMPDHIAPNDELYVVFGIEDDHADAFDVRIVDAATEDEIASNYVTRDCWAAEHEDFIHLEPGTLQPYHVYRAEVRAVAAGWTASRCERELIVADEVDENISLTVGYPDDWDNLGSDIETMAHIELEYSINAPGATFVRLYLHEYDWRDLWLDESDEHASYDWYRYRMDLNGGNYRLYARACYDELPEDFDIDALHYAGMSNPVSVTVYAYGDTAAPEVIVPDVDHAGEFLPVTIIPGETGTEFHFNIHDIDYEQVFCNTSVYNDSREEFTVYMPTSMLSEGEYVVEVNVREEGWNWYGTSRSFMVHHAGEAIFTVDRTSVETLEDVQMSVYAPGAEEARITCYTYREDLGEKTSYTEGYLDNGSWCSSIRFGWGYDVAELTAEIRYPGEEEWQNLGTISLTIYSNGPLDTANIDIPESLNYGDDLCFSFGDVNNAPHYGVFIYDAVGDLIFYDTPDSARSYDLPADSFQFGMTYTVQVFAHCQAYDVSCATTEFTCLHGDVDIDDSVTLTLPDGSNVLDCGAYEDIMLVLNAPDNAAFVRIFFDDNVHMDVWHDGIGYHDREIMDMVYSGTHTFYARACYAEDPDDIDWENLQLGGMSRPVVVVGRVYGKVEMPDFELVVPENVGEAMKVIIHQNQEGYVRYGAYIRPASDEVEYREYNCITFDHDDAGTFEIEMSTMGLQPGFEYRLVLDSYVGGLEMACTLEVPGSGMFTIANDAPEMKLVVSPVEIMVNENVQICAKLPENCAGLELNCYDGNGNREYVDAVCEEGWLNAGWTTNMPGEYEFVLTVYMDDGSKRVSDAAAVTVSAIGELEQIVIHAPDFYTEGDELEFSFDNVPNAESYGVWVEEAFDDWQWLYYERFDEATTIRLPSDLFTAGNTYRINVQPYAYQYSNRDDNGFVDFYVHPANETSVTLTADVDGQEVTADSEIQLTINAPGASLVRLYRNSWGYEDIHYYDDEQEGFDNRIKTITLPGGNYSLYFKAYYTTLEEFDPEVDQPDDVAVSNAVILRVATVGKLDAPSVQVPAEGVLGESLPVTIYPVENAERYEIHIWNDDSGWYQSVINSDPTGTEPFTVEVDLEYLEPDMDSWIQVTACADGYKPAASRMSDGKFYLLPAAVDEYIRMQNECYVNDTVGVQAYARGYDYGMWHVYYPNNEEEAFDCYGSCGFFDIDIVCGEPGNYRIVFELFDEDGHSHELSAELTAMELPKLDAPQIICEPAYASGENVEFWVGGVENAAYYSVAVELWNRDNYLGEILVLDMEEGSYTISGEDLMPGYMYRIKASAECDGWEGNGTFRDFVVYSNTDENITLCVNGQTNVEAMCNESVDFTVTAPGAKMLRVMSTANGFFWIPGWECIDVEKQIWKFDWRFENDQVIYVQAYYGDANLEEMSLEEWDNLPYQGISNPVTVKVKVIGEAVLPEIISMPGSVEFGSDAVFQLKPAMEGLTYRITLSGAADDGYWVDDNVECKPEGMDEFTVNMSTLRLRPGTYSVEIEVSAPGMIRATQYEPECIRVEMVDASRFVQFRLPGNVSAIGEEAFANIAADYVIIPGSVTALESRTFADSGIRFVEIPDSVTSIADDAFANCYSVAIICDSYDSNARMFAEDHGIPFAVK